MSVNPEAIETPPALSVPLKLVCSEVWGGNRLIDAPIELPGIRGRIYSQPCGGGEGGDVHYLAVCGSGALARLWVGDVVGHGAAVAQISNEIHGLLQRYMHQPDQRRVLSDFNKRLQQIGFDAITTAAAATYNALKQELSISYAGHPPGWFYESQRGRWIRLGIDAPRTPGEIADIPLAVETNTIYNRRRHKVQTGDRLVLVTDGVLEAPNGKGELYGADGVQGILEQYAQAEPADLAAALLDSLRRFGPQSMTHDDVTLLVAEFVPEPRSVAIWHMLKNRVLRPRGNSTDPAFDDPRAMQPEQAPVTK
ncbi:MAG: PP2C family protein-serine/threonine phosphatase [Planctomycetota bacterium]